MVPKALPILGETNKRSDQGVGVTLSGVVINAGCATLEADSLHGRSSAELGISFSDDQNAARDGQTVYIVWIGIREGIDGGDGYYSAVSSPIRVDTKSGMGFRPGTHFTDMIAAIQGTVRLSGLGADETSALGEALRYHDADMWAHRSDDLRAIWRDPISSEYRRRTDGRCAASE